MSNTILELRDVHAAYGKSEVLHGVSLHVQHGEIVSLLGRNGMGKTTTLSTIVGLLPIRWGSVHYDGRDLTGLDMESIAQRGISLVPADRGIFQSLSVEENLRIAIRRGADWSLERVYQHFPRLAERRCNPGGALSGGEQQMLAIARALLQGPKLLLLDEPTEGLAPVIVDELVALIASIGRSGVSMVLVEQCLESCVALAARHYILEEGRVVFEGTGVELQADPGLLRRYLGLEIDH